MHHHICFHLIILLLFLNIYCYSSPIPFIDQNEQQTYSPINIDEQEKKIFYLEMKEPPPPPHTTNKNDQVKYLLCVLYGDCSNKDQQQQQQQGTSYIDTQHKRLSSNLFHGIPKFGKRAFTSAFSGIPKFG